MKKIAIVVSRFNEMITEKLLASTLNELKKSFDDEMIDVVKVPGACEIPFMLKNLAIKNEYKGMIALGAVIRGETPHFDYVCKMAQEGVLKVSLNNNIPIIFGVLTTDNIAQAMERADENKKNKGASFAEALVEMLDVISKNSNVI